MIKQIRTKQGSGIVSDPDYLEPKNPTRIFIVVTILSLVACGIVPALFADFVTALTPIFWLVFHVMYIGLLLVAYMVTMKQYNIERRRYYVNRCHDSAIRTFGDSLLVCV
ncbi:MAG: hypothetical protein OEV85_08870 [Candidatus Thorarchaeota archaeon]|nr:hypothetical protein [Candidatus Thorarchaeota archaeon]